MTNLPVLAAKLCYAGRTKNALVIAIDKDRSWQAASVCVKGKYGHFRLPEAPRPARGQILPCPRLHRIPEVAHPSASLWDTIFPWWGVRFPTPSWRLASSRGSKSPKSPDRRGRHSIGILCGLNRGNFIDNFRALKMAYALFDVTQRLKGVGRSSTNTPR